VFDFFSNAEEPSFLFSILVRVVKWYEAVILSHQPGFDSRPGKAAKNYQEPPSVPFNDLKSQRVLKMSKN